MNQKRSFKLGILVLLFSIGLMLSSSVFAQDRSINFEHGTWQEVLDKAKKENKLIFMDAYTTWCGPCKMMAKNTFTKNDVADFFNDKFINAKFDMEKGEGVKLAKKYQVRAYPTLLFINGDGEKVHLAVGYMDPAKLIAKGEHALDTDNNYLGMTKRFNSGELSSEFVLEYASLLQDTYLSHEEVLNKYWATQKDFSTNENWKLISMFDKSPQSDRYKYVVANQNAFVSKHGKKQVYDYMADAHFMDIYQAMRKGIINAENYDAEMAKVKQLNIPNSGQVVAKSDVLFYQHIKQDFKKMADAMAVLIEKYEENTPRVVNSYAWMIYEKVNDEALVAKAGTWMRDIVLTKELEAAYLDTYAALLFKKGDYKEAEKFEKQAIEIAKKSGDKTDAYEKMLAKIKAAM